MHPCPFIELYVIIQIILNLSETRLQKVDVLNQCIFHNRLDLLPEKRIYKLYKSKDESVYNETKSFVLKSN